MNIEWFLGLGWICGDEHRMLPLPVFTKLGHRPIPQEKHLAITFLLNSVGKIYYKNDLHGDISLTDILIAFLFKYNTFVRSKLNVLKSAYTNYTGSYKGKIKIRLKIKSHLLD